MSNIENNQFRRIMTKKRRAVIEWGATEKSPILQATM